jgi:hypothetical protein
MRRRWQGMGGRLAGVVIGLLLGVAAGAPAASAAPPRWIHLTPNASPPATIGQPIAFDAATGQLVLVDGNDTWLWDGSTWTLATPATKPPARTDPVMAYDASTKQLILFGGVQGQTILNDTWTWTGSNWVQLSPATSPPGTFDATMTYDGAAGQLLLFGGTKSPGFGLSNDTWDWTGTTWTQLHPVSSPTPRSLPAMGYDPATSQLLLVGGQANGGPVNDTWSWTGSTWSKLAPAASPPVRSGAALAYDAGTQQFLMTGGQNNATLLGDTWTWTGSNWTLQAPASAITPRDAPAMAYDPATAQLLVFGGRIGNGLAGNDTWVWTPLSVQTASVPAGAVGVPYSTTLQAISGTAPYTWSVSAGALPAGLALSPSGVISGPPTTAGTASFTVTALDATKPTATPATRTLTLKIFPAPKASVWVGNGGNSNINAFSLSATGNATPIATLSGALTGLNGVSGLAFDPLGELWVSSSNNDALEQFAPGATGNVAPTRTISGPNTGLVTPAGIALDPAGRVYVVESAAQAVAIFPAGASGNTPPVATISGPDTQLSTPVGIAVSGGKIWVSNQGDNALTSYPVSANGDATPSATISGVLAQLNYPGGLGLDGKGHLLVANFFGASVVKFALAGPFGDVNPTATIGGSDAQLSLPEAVDSDTNGRIYVANENGGENVYTPTGTAPTAVINGSATGLRAPSSTAVAPPLDVTTKTLPRAALGRRYRQPLAAILGQAPLHWRMASGQLPKGLKVTRSGTVTGTARQLGRFHITVSVRDAERHAQTAKARVTLIVARTPTVTRINRNHGSRHGGTTVTITGSGFSTARNATVVSFGRLRALRVLCRSSKTCSARTPPSHTAKVTVTMTVNGLASQRSRSAIYAYTG